MAKAQRRDIDLGIKRYEYGEAARPRVAVLQIETSKHYNGGLISDAQVFWVGDHSRSQMLGIGGPGGDFGKRVKVSGRDVKATQKAIDTQHAEVFTAEVVAQLVEAAKAHYSAVISAGVDGFRNTYERSVTNG